MKPRKAREVASGLKRKGSIPSNTHHTYYVLFVDGKRTSIHTKISHSERECDSFILSQIAKQLRLSDQDLRDLLDCPLSHGAYVKLLVRKKAITV